MSAASHTASRHTAHTPTQDAKIPVTNSAVLPYDRTYFELWIVDKVKGRGDGVYTAKHYHGNSLQGSSKSNKMVLGQSVFGKRNIQKGTALTTPMRN
jgi:hypothetical protein